MISNIAGFTLSYTEDCPEEGQRPLPVNAEEYPLNLDIKDVPSHGRQGTFRMLRYLVSSHKE